MDQLYFPVPCSSIFHSSVSLPEGHLLLSGLVVSRWDVHPSVTTHSLFQVSDNATFVPQTSGSLGLETSDASPHVGGSWVFPRFLDTGSADQQLSTVYKHSPVPQAACAGARSNQRKPLPVRVLRVRRMRMMNAPQPVATLIWESLPKSMIEQLTLTHV